MEAYKEYVDHKTKLRLVISLIFSWQYHEAPRDINFYKSGGGKN